MAASEFKKIICAMLDDPAVTKRDMRIAVYLHQHDAHRQELLQKFFSSEHDPSGSANRANLTRSIQHLKPYLDVEEAAHTTWYRLKEHF